MDSLTQAEALVSVATEPGFGLSCYAFGVLGGGLGYAIPIRSWEEGDELSRMHPDIVFRLFESPIEANHFGQERALCKVGLAFEYLRMGVEAWEILERENAFGENTGAVFTGPRSWEDGDDVVFMGETRGPRHRADSTGSGGSEESVVILPASGRTDNET